ncbi:copper chaperone [Thermoactinomyces sp. DSM 45891]|uniref:copper ion binding protein n=1 Tax=Thermoactinomyces sp. DSM 45891 TaxID=1761907 RepID=UPI00092045C0|nr:copper ion binding protein [Thermoactinomyces sp. DSM 45891]SFX80763.1 copper chaperone [Thermoactinomyces sp. DSM 45891]
MKKEVLKVNGMSCNHCVRSIEEALKKISVQVKVDVAGKTVSVEYDETQVNLEQIQQIIEDQGYDVM